MRCCFCSCMSVWANFRRDEYYIMGHHSFLFSYNNSATFSFTFFLIILFRLNIIKKKQLLTDVFNTCKKQILIFFFCFHVMRRDELFPLFRETLIMPLVLYCPTFWTRETGGWDDKTSEVLTSEVTLSAWIPTATWGRGLRSQHDAYPVFWDPRTGTHFTSTKQPATHNTVEPS